MFTEITVLATAVEERLYLTNHIIAELGMEKKTKNGTESMQPATFRYESGTEEKQF